MPELDLEWVRPQFPALSQEVDGRRAVFLDGPGGTQVPQRVIDAMADYLALDNANTGGAFATSARTEETIAAARDAMADLLGGDAGEIVFGPNMTTITFALARALARDLSPGDEIVITRLDHDANIAPWKALAESGIVLRQADLCEEDCTLDMDDLARKINSRTRLVAVTYASNAVGSLVDVGRVIRLARDAGAWVFVDAVHYAPHGPIDVRALDCDFLVCSPYKFFGPHLGVLYGKREHLERLAPYKVRPAPDTAPERWETGTQNHEGLAGLVATIEYLAELGRRSSGRSGGRREELRAAMDAIRSYERGLLEGFVAGLLAIPGLRFYGVREPSRFDRRVPTVSLRIEGHAPRALATRLGEEGIFTWDGNYYALALSERLGVEPSGGLLRLGLVHYNTAQEVDRTLETLQAVAAKPPPG